MQMNPYAPPAADTSAPGAATGVDGTLTDDEIIWFVDSNAAYYREVWHTPTRTGGFYAGFNLAAFFFGSLWFFYRRLYVSGAVVIVGTLAVAFLAGILTALLHGQHVLALLATFVATRVPTGLLGNALYLRRARMIVAEVRQQLGRAPAVPFPTRGGTNSAAVGVGIGVGMLLRMLHL